MYTFYCNCKLYFSNFISLWLNFAHRFSATHVYSCSGIGECFILLLCWVAIKSKSLFSRWASQMESVCEQLCGAHDEEEEEEEEGGRAMLWSLQEALERQTLQIGASACGATAVVDVLKALGVDVAPEEADRCVQTRLRRNESPLPDYLLSRSEAGKCPGWYSGSKTAPEGFTYKRSCPHLCEVKPAGTRSAKRVLQLTMEKLLVVKWEIFYSMSNLYILPPLFKIDKTVLISENLKLD